MALKNFISRDNLVQVIKELRTKFATFAQGAKADSAVQSVKITGDETEYNNGTSVLLPAYPDVSDKLKGVKVGENTPVATEGVVDITADVNTLISSAISDFTGSEFVILTSGQYNPDTKVPTIDGANGKIYLVPNDGSVPNQYNEYIWIASTSSFELIGTTEIDLSNYLKNEDVSDLTPEQVSSIVTDAFTDSEGA